MRFERGSLVPVTVYLCVVSVLAVYTVVTLSEPGVPDMFYTSMTDFREQAYLPARSLLDGVNPYDPEAHISHSGAINAYAPYTPIALLLAIPFALLPLPIAEAAFFAVNCLLILSLAWFALRWHERATVNNVFVVASLLLLSRPAQWNLVLGQFGAFAAVVTAFALYRGAFSPRAAGVALALAAFKPTFGVPAALIMIAQRDYKAVTIGIGAGAALCGVVLVPLAANSGGAGEFVATLWRGYLDWESTWGQPDAARRADAAHLFSRLFGIPGIEIWTMVILFTGGLLVIRRAAGQEGASTWNERARVAGFGTLLLATTLYRPTYDLLVLVPALVWLWTRTKRWRPPTRSATIFVLLCVPFVNYLQLGRVPHWLGIDEAWMSLFASLNACALVAAMGIWAMWLLRGERGDNLSDPGR